jgi:ribosomal-protein-alanine N-acetyltransferase
MPVLNFTPFPVLTTKRLLLRQLTADDEPAIFELRTDDEVNKYLDRLKARTIIDARKFIEKINRNISNNESIIWGISLLDEPKLIGTVCFWNISQENNSAELGYELLPAHQGKGIMQETLAAVIAYGFETMNVKTIEAFAHIKNRRSYQLLEKLSFTRDSEREKQLAGKKEYSDTIVFSLANNH